MRAALSRSVIAPLVMAKNGSRELAYLRHYRRTQFLPPEQLAEHQLLRLRELVAHALTHSPFYARHLRNAGLAQAGDVHSLDDLTHLPLLAKEMLRESWSEILVPDPGGPPRQEKRTSGSTGMPLRIFVDEAARQHKAALTARHNGWAGYRLGDPVGYVWGDVEIPTSLRGRMRAALLERAEVLDSQQMEEARMAEFTARLRRRRVRVLIGHAQPLCHYAHYLLAVKAPDLPVRAAVPTAMALYPGQRGLLEQAFGAVFERYGSEETSIIASECAEHRGRHIAAEGLIVEVLDERGAPVPPGQEGEIVITDLLNRATPLIRYRIGDAGIRGEACTCGRGLPVLARVSGRLADNVVTPEGKVVSGISITDHLVEVEGIRQVQIVQEAREELVFRIVRDDRFTEGSEVRLRQHCARIFGEGMRVRCEFVSAISAGPGGKYRLCISHLAEEERPA